MKESIEQLKKDCDKYWNLYEKAERQNFRLKRALENLLKSIDEHATESFGESQEVAKELLKE